MKRIKSFSCVMVLLVSICISAYAQNSAEEYYTQVKEHQALGIKHYEESKWEEAFKEYNDYTWSNPNSEKAYSILTGNSLQFIDLGLLSPDVSRCYNDIVSRLLGRLNPAKLPEWYSVCVNAKKFKLEDF